MSRQTITLSDEVWIDLKERSIKRKKTRRTDHRGETEGLWDQNPGECARTPSDGSKTIESC